MGSRKTTGRIRGLAALCAAVALIGLATGGGAAFGDEAAAPLCAAAAKEVAGKANLAAEVAAVFGKARFAATGDDCIYPLKVLHYADADALITQAGEPGAACHGCGAVLSAYVLRRVGDGFRVVARFHEFAKVGSSGAAADIFQVVIAGDDAIAVESGGTFQGYTSTSVEFFAFHAGSLVGLNVSPIVIAADNSGAEFDPQKIVSVDASWFVDPADKTAIVVDYKVKAKGGARSERAVWRLVQGKFALSQGRVPAEVEAASGGGAP